jgi:formylglycine-generating enzyme required for sulfatase activity
MRHTAARYRLPTEAEWEYACRAGTTTQYSFGDDTRELPRHAWYSKNASDVAHPVGLKPANQFGLHDMHGNAWEWCQDFYDEQWYQKPWAKAINGPAFGPTCVFRGGSFDFDALHCRSAYRNNGSPAYRIGYGGFRCVCEVNIEQ